MQVSKGSIFLLFLIGLFLHHSFGYIGHYGFDDLLYARLSADLAEGVLDFENHYTFRFPILLLTALSYSLLGVSDFSSSLPPLLISSLSLSLVFLMLRDEKRIILVSGMSMMLFSKWFLIYSDKLMPDIYVLFGVLAMIAVYYFYRYKSDQQRPYFYSFMFVFALLFTLNAKETVILILPLLIYYFVVDIISGKNKWFWIFSFLNGIVGLGLYLLLIKWMTGSFMKRFSSLAQNSYINPCSYELQPAKVVIERVSYEFVNMTIYQGLFFGFIFVAAEFLSRSPWEHFRLKSPFSFLLSTGMILYLSSNFMSISYTGYSPMCVDPRHFLFIIPILSMAASFVIYRFVQDGSRGGGIILILLSTTVISYFLPDLSFYTTYLPLTCLFVVFYIFKDKEKWQVYFYIFFILMLLMAPLLMVRDAMQLDYRGQRKFVFDNILQDNESKYIITNDVQRRLGNYYLGFKDDSPVKFLEFREFIDDKSIQNDSIPKYLLKNWYTEYLSFMDYNSLPYFARDILDVYEVVADQKNPEMILYDMNYYKPPQDTLLIFFKDFEEKSVQSSTELDALTRDYSFSGEFSNKFSEYSFAWTYPSDSLQLKGGEVIIKVDLKALHFEKTNAKIVISLEKDGVAYLWKSQEITKFLKALGNWFSASFEIKLNSSELGEGSYFKIYVWNEDNRIVYIDDMQIVILH